MRAIRGFEFERSGARVQLWDTRRGVVAGCSRMISSSPFNLRMMRVRDAQAKGRSTHPRGTQRTSTGGRSNRLQTHGTRRTHKDDSDLYRICASAQLAIS